MTDAQCVALLQWALPRLGLRWRGFSNVRGQVCKRIARRMKALGLADADRYRARLEEDPTELREFDALCRVTITRFHRDRGIFGRLVPLLADLGQEATGAGRPLRVLSAGAASGEEPYTLSIALSLGVSPRVPQLRFEVVAVEVDPVLLERAGRGCYPAAVLRELPQDWREEAFEATATLDLLRLRDRFRAPVVFLQQDVREELPPGPFDAVLCRNLAFTYFELPLQERTLDRLVERLRPAGLLVIGGHEVLPAAGQARHRLAAVPGGAALYRRA